MHACIYVCVHASIAGWGLLHVEQHELSIVDHAIVEDLRVKVCGTLRQSKIPKVLQAAKSPGTLKLQINVSWFACLFWRFLVLLFYNFLSNIICL